MKYTELNKFIVGAFRARFTPTGIKKSKYRFIKIFGDLYFYFLHSIVDNDNSFPTTFGYNVGSVSCRNILNKVFQGGYNEKGDFYPVMFGVNQIGLFDKGKYPILEYDIYTEQDAQTMVDEVSDYILNSVLPPWEANPTIEYLEKQVNSEVKDVPNFSGLILAKMVDNPNFELIKDTLVSFSSNWSEFDKKDLASVIEFLDAHSSKEIMQIGNQ